MKKNIILVFCLLVTLGITGCSKKEDPLPANNTVAETTNLESYTLDTDNTTDETTYTNDHFDFSITVGSDWQPFKDSDPEAFKSEKKEASLALSNLNYRSGIVIYLDDFYGTYENYTLDEYTKMNQSVGLKYPNMSNISEIKKTTLDGVDFRYYTLDAIKDNVTQKIYHYTANKDKKFYTISILNLTDDNKDELIKVLKSISIK